MNFFTLKDILDKLFYIKIFSCAVYRTYIFSHEYIPLLFKKLNQNLYQKKFFEIVHKNSVNQFSKRLYLFSPFYVLEIQSN